MENRKYQIFKYFVIFEWQHFHALVYQTLASNVTRVRTPIHSFSQRIC